jgi:hypothetical protein
MFGVTPDQSMCPPDVRESLLRYQDKGIPTGDFLRNVLGNNLMGAVGHADMRNCAALPHICAFVYNSLDANCHGSPERVKAWLDKFRAKAGK